MALKYAKLQQFKTTLVLKDFNRKVATTMKAKKALVWKLTFPKPLVSLKPESYIISGTIYTKVTIEVIRSALIIQTIAKISKPNKINFRILHRI